jgi:NAD(P)-dependent dehydrogenase (short-subunit alcohol dehydrogenase family)
MMLKNKVAVIYGAGGAIGGAVARAFTREGAMVYLTGRSRMPLDAVMRDISQSGGSAEAALVDALDEKAIDAHLQGVVEQAGRVDISFNAINIAHPGSLGVPLIEQEVEAFLRPIAAYATSYFLTARLAARRMAAKKSGVIMTVSALPSRMSGPLIGGYSPAMAAKEALTRSLSLEVAPLGVRVVSVRPHAIPETPSMQQVYKQKAAKLMTWEQWLEGLASRTHARRLSTLAEVGNTAAFLASDLASGLTGTTVNLSLGALDD